MNAVWMHKETGDLAIVRPFFDVECSKVCKGENFVVAYGAQQDGWVLVNQYGITMVLPLGIEDYFEDLGEL